MGRYVFFVLMYCKVGNIIKLQPAQAYFIFMRDVDTFSIIRRCSSNVCPWIIGISSTGMICPSTLSLTRPSALSLTRAMDANKPSSEHIPSSNGAEDRTANESLKLWIPALFFISARSCTKLWSTSSLLKLHMHIAAFLRQCTVLVKWLPPLGQHTNWSTHAVYHADAHMNAIALKRCAFAPMSCGLDWASLLPCIFKMWCRWGVRAFGLFNIVTPFN